MLADSCPSLGRKRKDDTTSCNHFKVSFSICHFYLFMPTEHWTCQCHLVLWDLLPRECSIDTYGHRSARKDTSLSSPKLLSIRKRGDVLLADYLGGRTKRWSTRSLSRFGAWTFRHERILSVVDGLIALRFLLLPWLYSTCLVIWKWWWLDSFNLALDASPLFFPHPSPLPSKVYIYDLLSHTYLFVK